MTFSARRQIAAVYDYFFPKPCVHYYNIFIKTVKMYSLRANIQGYYENIDSITFYTIVVICNPSNTSWVCNRKLEEFHELYKSLRYKYTTVPVPPGFSTFSYVKLFFKSVENDLNKFIQEVLDLPGIYACEEISSFFSLDLHLQTHFLMPILIREYSTRFPTICVCLDSNVMFTADANPSPIERLEKYVRILNYPGSEMSIIRCFNEEKSWNISSVEIVTTIE